MVRPQANGRMRGKWRDREVGTPMAGGDTCGMVPAALSLGSRCLGGAVGGTRL